MKLQSIYVSIAVVLLSCSSVFDRADALEDQNSEAEREFEAIQPILNTYCIQCHGETQVFGRLRLDLFPPVSEVLVTQREIADHIVARLRQENRPMPPARIIERPSELEIKAIETWAATILPDAHD